MRTSLQWILPVFLVLLSACTGPVQAELDETHVKLQALQELVGAVNRDLTTLDLIVKELDDGHTIRPESLRLTEDGYEVSFQDGKKVFIPFGKDGEDGRSLIPVGVKDEDGVYWWQVDEEWLLDAEGNRIRAGATDGIPPQFIVEGEKWLISVDGGKSFSEFASCDEMNGVGVFKDVQQTSSGTVKLTLWNGEVVELMSQFPFRLSFEGAVRDTLLVAPGEVLPIPYKVLVEGATDQPLVVTSGTDGVYLSGIERETDTTGVVRVHAPAVYADGYILLSASCGGYSAVKMITFRPREITPAVPFVTVRLGSGDEPQVLSYETNFEYTVKVSPDDSWLDVAADRETGTLTLTPRSNTGSEVRSCEVTLSPKDNPDFVCTTFLVLQATDSFTVQLQEDTPFTFDPASKTLSVPAEGGDGDLWITFPSALAVTAPETVDWIQTALTDVGGFRLLQIHVDPETSGTGRECTLTLRLQSGAVPIGDIKVVQAGAAAVN